MSDFGSGFMGDKISHLAKVIESGNKQTNNTLAELTQAVIELTKAVNSAIEHNKEQNSQLANAILELAKSNEALAITDVLDRHPTITETLLIKAIKKVEKRVEDLNTKSQ